MQCYGVRTLLGSSVHAYHKGMGFAWHDQHTHTTLLQQTLKCTLETQALSVLSAKATDLGVGRVQGAGPTAVRQSLRHLAQRLATRRRGCSAAPPQRRAAPRAPRPPPPAASAAVYRSAATAYSLRSIALCQHVANQG